MRTMLASLLTVVGLYAQGPPDFTPPTPLLGAVMRNDAAAVKRLLGSGADPNEGRFLGVPPLLLSIANRNREAAEALIAAGADPKAVDGAGTTSLMFASYHEPGDAALVKRLIELGVDPNAKNKKGETAIEWAKRRGSTPTVEALRQAGASDAETIRRSVEKAIALLQRSAPEFVKVSGCASCHHQSLPQMAWAAARRRGMAVDEAAADKQVKTVLGMYRPLTAMMAAGKQNLPNPPISVGYSLAGLAAEGYPGDETTAAMAHLVGTYQRADGSFALVGVRPPLEASEFSAAALSIRSLQIYGKDADAGERVERAAGWLAKARPATGEDYAMRLLGLAWAKGPAAAIDEAARELTARQRQDGGWAQLDALETDAYATGMALAALEASGRVAVSDALYRRGVDYLLRTQFDDGSWLVRSRSMPLQPYRESGYPHGRHQWISAAGASWAAMALGATQPPALQKLSQRPAGVRGE